MNMEPPGENETHRALLNDVVLQNIFKYLGYKDLRSCRQVGNTTSLKNSKQAWWSQTKVTFEYEKNAEDRVADYLSQIVIISNATNYKFGSFCHNSKRFLTNFGHSIKHLEIETWELTSLDDFRQVFNTWCPNVEKIVVIDLQMDADLQPGIVELLEPLEWQEPQFGENQNLKYLGSYSDLPVSWMELFSHFPYLQVVKARARNDGIFKAISIIRRHDPKMLKLNEIRISGFETDEYGDVCDYDMSYRLVYLDPKLSLKKLFIEFANCEEKTLEDILELHANSLEELRVEQFWNENPKILSVRKPLEALEELKISGCGFTANFFKHVPNVRKVELQICANYSLLEAADPNLIISTCKELTLDTPGPAGHEPFWDLPFFLNLFPNVERFEIRGLNNLEFAMVCERWKKLKSFYVHWRSQVGVTGLLGYDPCSTKSEGARKPNITDLKDLQSFSMMSKATCMMNGWNLTEMDNGGVLLNELKGLQQLNEFRFEDYTHFVERRKDLE